MRPNPFDVILQMVLVFKLESEFDMQCGRFGDRWGQELGSISLPEISLHLEMELAINIHHRAKMTLSLGYFCIED